MGFEVIFIFTLVVKNSAINNHPNRSQHLIYIGGLKFDNHNNFDGVKISWKGKLIATFKLIEPINIDELESMEYFKFNRVTSIRGKKTEKVIRCKVKGVRYIM